MNRYFGRWIFYVSARLVYVCFFFKSLCDLFASVVISSLYESAVTSVLWTWQGVGQALFCMGTCSCKGKSGAGSSFVVCSHSMYRGLIYDSCPVAGMEWQVAPCILSPLAGSVHDMEQSAVSVKIRSVH
jgi:hypothetical protein